MKTIYLDCDGVININSPSYYTNWYRPDGSVIYFEEHLIQRLNWLIEKSEASVVISSSWKSDMQDLQKQMELSGFRYWDKVIGRTPNKLHRGDEIQAHLDANPEIKCFVVLEDEPEDVCGDRCDTIHLLNVIEVDPKIGLTHENVDLAYHKLWACERRENLK